MVISYFPARGNSADGPGFTVEKYAAIVQTGQRVEERQLLHLRLRASQLIDSLFETGSQLRIVDTQGELV